MKLRLSGRVQRHGTGVLQQFGQWENVWNGDVLQRKNRRSLIVETLQKVAQLSTEKGFARGVALVESQPRLFQSLNLQKQAKKVRLH